MMKLIAHRGASKVKMENTLESLSYAASIGADAVECDVRPTKDGKYVIFHDGNLERLAGVPRTVEELTYAEMKDILSHARRGLMTLDELIDGYRETTPVLLHIKMNAPDDLFAERIGRAPVDFICGVQTIEALKTMRKVRPSERILAFMPEAGLYRAFSAGGAGILRLWQQWLPALAPETVKRVHPGEVWVMSWKDGMMDGDEESLDEISRLGADGVLLNDIELGLRWRASHVETR
ncbi:MAG: glycerophosphodiester phosphodiesterase family protein [Clostridiaceae bacterium]|nr:glycerophosphodiester phosphodiesterase family protein [Clostridiaceae bacterium]